MTAKDAFETLCERLDFPASARLRAILQSLMTADQARLAAALPGTVDEVAARAGVDPEEAAHDLDDLFYKGVVFPKGDLARRTEFRLARHVIQLHDACLATQQLMVPTHKPFFKKWHDFCLEEMYPAMVDAYQALEAPPTRVVPAHKAIKDLPGVLPEEDFHELLKAQKLIAVVPCSCRFRTNSVEEPCARHKETRLWVCLQFGRGAEYVLERGSGRRLTLGQAIELADTVEDHGLVHMWGNSAAMSGVHTSCQCCDDCCMNAVSARRSGADIGIMWQKSRYEAFVADPDRCDGCEDCVERCPFGAIEMRSDDNGLLTSSISAEKCYGCGVCVVGCPSGAVRMREVRPPDFIPREFPTPKVAH